MPVQNEAQLAKVAEKVNGENPPPPPPPPPHLCIFEEDFYLDMSRNCFKKICKNIPVPIQSNISWQLPT